MFGYCIWYKILDKHMINLIKEIALVLNTNSYNPHLTIKYNLKTPNLKLLEIYKKKKHPIFQIYGNIYQTEENQFYAIQQDYVNLNDNELYHVSLAYNDGKKFTDMEINSVKKIIDKTELTFNDVNVKLYNCNSKNCKAWFEIN